MLQRCFLLCCCRAHQQFDRRNPTELGLGPRQARLKVLWGNKSPVRDYGAGPKTSEAQSLQVTPNEFNQSLLFDPDPIFRSAWR